MTEPRSDRVDPEVLAALIDGKLAEPRRSEVLAQLARSSDDLALLADVAAVAREEDVTPAARVPRKHWGARQAGWLALAAGVVGITTLTLTRRDERRPLPDGISFAFPQWQAGTRGAGVALDTVALSWRVGTRVVDLDAAIAARDSARVTSFARELEGMLATASAGLSSSIFGAIAGRSDEVEAQHEELDSLARLGRQALTRRVDPEIVSLAAWLESVRIDAHGAEPASISRRPDIDQRIGELMLLAPSTAARLRDAIAARQWDDVRRGITAALDTLGR